MQIDLQKCNLADLERIQKIGRATYEPYYQHIWKTGGLDWYIQLCFNSQSLIAELNDPNIAYFLPTDEFGNVIGILKIGLQKSIPETKISNALYLEKIYLMPSFFGKGIGQILIEKVKNMASELKREAIWLYVMQTGPIKRYEQAGFKMVGSIDFGYDMLIDSERFGWLMVHNLKSVQKE
jgi:diamine N-acetyltransferase